MPGQTIEVFKTRIDWDLGPFHSRKTEPAYVSKIDPAWNVDAAIPSLAEKLLSLYTPDTKIALLEKKQTTTVIRRNEDWAGLEVLHEPLSYSDISMLLTSLADKGFSSSNSSLPDRKPAALHLFNAQAAYHLAPDTIRETEPCFVLARLGHTQTFDYPHDRIDSIPRSVLYYFAPGTSIHVPEWRNAINRTYIDSFNANQDVFVEVIHKPLSYQEISTLVTAFVAEIYQNREKEQEDLQKQEATPVETNG